MKAKEIMEALEGNEVWTDALGTRFGERVCVMIEGDMLWNNGKKFKPTVKEIKGVWENHIENEFGSREQMMKNLEAEFGGKLK